LRDNQALSAALSAVTAAVVGVVLNLAIWFALHVVFGEVNVVQAFGLKLQVPVLATLDVASLVLAIGAFVAMLRFHVGMIPVIFVSAALGAGWYMLT
jgi:chromate transporter